MRSSRIWWRLAVQKFVENAVDELRALGAAEALGKFDGFVDRGAVGRVGIEDFVGAEAEDVAVSRGHAGDGPVVGDFGELGIEFTLVAADAEDERQAKLFELRCAEATLDERLHVGDRGARIDIVLEEDLEGDFTGTGAAGH